MIREVLSRSFNRPRINVAYADPERLFTKLHIHDEYEIIFIVRGEMKLWIDSKVYAYEKDEAVIITKNFPHATLSSPDNIYCLIQFDFNGLLDSEDVSEELSSNIYLPFLRPYAVIYKRSPFWKEIYNVVQSIYEHAEFLDNFPEYIKGDFYHIFALMSKLSMLTADNDMKSKKGYQKISNIIKYINQNYSSSLTLEEISNTFKLDPSYLCRAFKKSTSYTIVEYINYVRVKHAEQLLIESNETIKNIATLTGFSSQAYFNRIFKNWIQMTPLQYRKFRNQNIDATEFNSYYYIEGKGGIN